eukprot:TRINITY_DN6012_c0_g1_i1.p1 TRINITY_DN6012_c0_g1~~TRINITY_DN6012_c0_g1_i1.p1  ORF type:complete len:155 (+),score=43.08 TRINITY_DN6012_c0_g1_i1:1174-1638(+)
MGNQSIKIAQDNPQEKAAPVTPKPAAEPGKRHLKDMKKDYEKLKKEFMEKATKQIRELLAKLGQAKSEAEKNEINNTIDLIKKEMENYSVQKKAAPPRKERISSPFPRNKKFEVGLEDIAKELQNYGSLIAKLKVAFASHLDRGQHRQRAIDGC